MTKAKKISPPIQITSDNNIRKRTKDIRASTHNFHLPLTARSQAIATFCPGRKSYRLYLWVFFCPCLSFVPPQKGSQNESPVSLWRSDRIALRLHIVLHQLQ